MALCIYSGGDTGYEGKGQDPGIISGIWMRKKYLVIVNSFYNRRKDPPPAGICCKEVKNVWDLHFLT